jgi:hypothetical protein
MQKFCTVRSKSVTGKKFCVGAPLSTMPRAASMGIPPPVSAPRPDPPPIPYPVPYPCAPGSGGYRVAPGRPRARSRAIGGLSGAMARLAGSTLRTLPPTAPHRAGATGGYRQTAPPTSASVAPHCPRHGFGGSGGYGGHSPPHSPRQTYSGKPIVEPIAPRSPPRGKTPFFSAPRSCPRPRL